MVKLTNILHRILLGTLLVAISAYVLGPAELNASILTDDSLAIGLRSGFSTHELEQSLKRLQSKSGVDSGCGTGSCGSGTKPASSEPIFPLSPSEREDKSPEYANFSPNSGGAGSSNSSTSSVGTSAGAPVAAIAVNSVALIDDPRADGCAGERVIFLPDAPGLDLLRPPQGRI